MNSMTLLLVAMAAFITMCGATCSLPSDLQGSWATEGRLGTTTITSSMLIGLRLEQYPDIVFNCHINSGSKYVFSSNVERLFGVAVKIYFCLDFQKTSSSSFEMYELTHKVGLYYEDRARAFLISDDPSVSMSDVCQLTRSEVIPRTIKRL